MLEKKDYLRAKAILRSCRNNGIKDFWERGTYRTACYLVHRSRLVLAHKHTRADRLRDRQKKREKKWLEERFVRYRINYDHEIPF